MPNVAWVLIGFFALGLLVQRWFWILAFGIGTIASGFAVLASIFHFQILAALGFMFLTMAFAAGATVAAGG